MSQFADLTAMPAHADHHKARAERKGAGPTKKNHRAVLLFLLLFQITPLTSDMPCLMQNTSGGML